MSAVFISYRRNDSSGHTGRIYDRLCSEFGKEFVFRDIDTIEPGTDFIEAVEKGIQECSVLIVVIGRDWLTAEDEMGRRLDDPNDFVRIEIASSLKKGLHVMPVLVRGARMPPSKELPEEIAQLSRLLALEISDSRWDYDMQRLIETLSHFIRQDRQAKDADNRVAADDVVHESDPGKRTSTLPEPSVADSGVKNRRWLIMAIAIIFFASLVATVFWQFRSQQEYARESILIQDDADERDSTEKSPLQQQDSAVDEKRSKIEELLADAGVDIKASRLIVPAGNNAVAKYQEILELEPENSSAQRGLNSIAEVLIHQTRSALEDDALEKAGELLEQVRALNPASVNLDQLGVEIEQRMEQRVQQEREEEESKAQQQRQEEGRREAQRVQQEREEESKAQQQEQEEESRREAQRVQQQKQEEESRREAQRVQQEREEEERKAQQQKQEEESRREAQRVQQEREEEERKAQQQKQKVEKKRKELQSRRKREEIKSGKNRKTCLNRCANRYQGCLKKPKPAAGNCSSQARKKCKQAHRNCLLDPQNTMIMGVSGVESHCNGKFSRCIKLKTAQCSGTKGSSSSACKSALSSCKKTCR